MAHIRQRNTKPNGEIFAPGAAERRRRAHVIRSIFRVCGMSNRELSRRTGVDRKSCDRFMADGSVTPYGKTLDAYSREAERILTRLRVYGAWLRGGESQGGGR